MLKRRENSMRGVVSSVIMNTLSTDLAPIWKPRLASPARMSTGTLQRPLGFLTMITP